jgi:hypothetical protein
MKYLSVVFLMFAACGTDDTPGDDDADAAVFTVDADTTDADPLAPDASADASVADATPGTPDAAAVPDALVAPDAAPPFNWVGDYNVVWNVQPCPGWAPPPAPQNRMRIDGNFPQNTGHFYTFDPANPASTNKDRWDFIFSWSLGQPADIQLLGCTPGQFCAVESWTPTGTSPWQAMTIRHEEEGSSYAMCNGFPKYTITGQKL